MNRAHEQLVDAQFGPRAKAYVESAVHARGPDLEALGGRVAACDRRALSTSEPVAGMSRT